MSYVSGMPVRLTDKAIQSLKPKAKRYFVADAACKNLAIRIQPNGKRAWYIRKLVNGTNIRKKFDEYSRLSLAGARKYALELSVSMLTTKVERQVPSFGEVRERFIQLHVRENCKDVRNYVSRLKKFSHFDDWKITDISRRHIFDVLDKLRAKGNGASVNRTLANIRKLFNWALDRGYIDINPISNARAIVKEVPRDRFLTDDELGRVWGAAEAEGFPFGPLVQVLILTGQRRSEVAEMKWCDLDLDNGIWMIPADRAKNGSAHEVPLADTALEIMRSVPRFPGSDYVFTTTGRSPISGYGRLKKRLDSSSGVSDWRLHDLRRTTATGMAKLGIAPHIIEAVLNHRSGIVSGVAATYNRYAYADEKGRALEAWAQHVEQIKPQAVLSELD